MLKSVVLLWHMFYLLFLLFDRLIWYISLFEKMLLYKYMHMTIFILYLML